MDNPEIHGTSRGDDYTCLAPWDTVLNEADNVPGGEPAPDGAEIGERCREAGGRRFGWAAGAGAAAIALTGLAAVCRGRRHVGSSPSRVGTEA